MLHRTLRIVPALVLAAAVSAGAGASVAAAMPIHSVARTATVVVHTRAPAVAYLQVQAGATGDGDADDEICSSYEIQINQNYHDASNALDDGDADRAEGLVEAAGNVTNMALDAGCFVTDPV